MPVLTSGSGFDLRLADLAGASAGFGAGAVFGAGAAGGAVGGRHGRW